MNRKYIYFFGGIAVGATVLFFAGRWAYQKFDIGTQLHLSRLQPKFRKKVEKFLAKAKKAGFDLRIISSERDCQEQNKLYAQGRTQPGNVVTNARCGQSAHNYKLAIDVVEYKDGKPWWESPNWNQIGRIGESVGLEWGGNWRSFKDRPHFQDLRGVTLADRYQRYQQSGELTFFGPGVLYNG